MEDVIISVTTQKEVISVFVVKDSFSQWTAKRAKVRLSLSLYSNHCLYLDHGPYISRSRDVISHVVIRVALCDFL